MPVTMAHWPLQCGAKSAFTRQMPGLLEQDSLNGGLLRDGRSRAVQVCTSDAREALAEIWGGNQTDAGNRRPKGV